MLPVTPQPRYSIAAMRFEQISISNFSLHFANFQSGSPEDRTRHNLVISKAWTTSPQLPFCSHRSRIPRSRTETLLVPNQACFHLHLYPICVAASVGAYLPCQWAGRRSNPRLRFFRPPLDRLSYQPKLGSLLGLCVQCGHEKRLDVCVTPSLPVESNSLAASVTSDADTSGHYHSSTIARRKTCLHVSFRVD